MKLLFTALVSATALSAFAQGKVAMQNNVASLVTLTSDTAKVLPADVALAGLAVGNNAPLASGITLVAGIYASPLGSPVAGPYAPRSGDSKGYLLNNVASGAGLIPATTYQLNANGVLVALPAGQTTIQVKVWDSAFDTYEAALAGFSYVGESEAFTFTTGGATTYPNITSALSSPIVVGLESEVVPEPGVVAMMLVTVGGGAGYVWRRKSQVAK